MASKSDFHPYGVSLALPSGEVVLSAGDNMTIFPQGNFITFAAQIPAGAVINNVTAWQPPVMANSKAPNNSVYYSTDASKLVYKDIGGSVHALY